MNIEEIELNSAKGWEGRDVSFLYHLRGLKALKIVDLRLDSDDPVHCLEDLRALHLTTYCKNDLDFSVFHDLEYCGLEWRRGVTGLFDRSGLIELFVNNLPSVYGDELGKLKSLATLTLLNSAIHDIAEIGRIPSLINVRFGELRNLDSLSPISELRKLEVLDVQKCRKIDNIEPLANLRSMLKLLLNDDGPIQSIRPIAGMQYLQLMSFYESTNILDGDLSPLLHLKHLRRVAFRDRRHYSHRRSFFEKAVPEPQD